MAKRTYKSRIKYMKSYLEKNKKRLYDKAKNGMISTCQRKKK